MTGYTTTDDGFRPQKVTEINIKEEQIHSNKHEDNRMEEREINIQYDAGAEDALDIAFRLLDEFNIKFEYNGEGTIKYWVETNENE